MISNIRDDITRHLGHEMRYKMNLKYSQARVIFKKFQSDANNNEKTYMNKMRLSNSLCAWSNYRYFLSNVYGAFAVCSGLYRILQWFRKNAMCKNFGTSIGISICINYITNSIVIIFFISILNQDSISHPYFSDLFEYIWSGCCLY